MGPAFSNGYPAGTLTKYRLRGKFEKWFLWPKETNLLHQRWNRKPVNSHRSAVSPMSEPGPCLDMPCSKVLSSVLYIIYIIGRFCACVSHFFLIVLGTPPPLLGKLFWQVKRLIWQVGKLFWQLGNYFGRWENYFGSWENYFGRWEKCFGRWVCASTSLYYISLSLGNIAQGGDPLNRRL